MILTQHVESSVQSVEKHAGCRWVVCGGRSAPHDWSKDFATETWLACHT